MQPKIKQWHSVGGITNELAQFETVFWEPDDTTSLRSWFVEHPEVDGANMLEIGVGTGIISLSGLIAGVESAVATDINPMACMNARYNAELLDLDERLEIRQVMPTSPGPFSVIGADEQFDLIVSNPPWEDAPVEEVAAHALYDPGFALLDGLVAEAHLHLKPGGKLLLAYGAKTAIKRILATASQSGWNATVADTRDLETLPEVFLPGMLLVLERPQK